MSLGRAYLFIAFLAAADGRGDVAALWIIVGLVALSLEGKWRPR